MAKLSNEVKAFIVKALARFDGPKEIADAVKEEFGLTVSRQLVHGYDPTRSGQKPAKKWCKMHAEERAAFLSKIRDIPSANKAVRIARLERMAVKAESKGNMPLAAQLYEQIAKEVGRAYTNRQVHKLKGDKDEPLSCVFRPVVPHPIGAPNAKPGNATD